MMFPKKIFLFFVLMFYLVISHASTEAGKNSAVLLNTDIYPYEISVDGEQILPQIFFFNTDIGKDTYLKPQMEMARKAGIHIYSFPLRVPMKYPTNEPNYQVGEKLLNKFIAIDQDAMFIVRLAIGPNGYWKEFYKKNEQNKNEYFTYYDGSKSNYVSFASNYFYEPTSEQLRKIVAYYEKKYGKHILAYHVAPDLSEMFDTSYRRKGPDYSIPNMQKFREYLKKKYINIDALRKAWGNNQVDFQNASLPQPPSTRFPMRTVQDKCINVFYKPVQEQAWVDYSQFYSELISDHVIRWCEIVKEVTGGKKLTVAFYGYLFSLPGSFSGHLNLSEILQNQNVDIVCSPISYSDRMAGGAGSFMAPVDSVILHKKLWINEDDTRTYAVDRKMLKDRRFVIDGKEETLGIIDRNLANILAHGCGIWWMDLHACGMFNSQSVWELIAKRKKLFENSTQPKKNYSASVQLIVDEKSKFYFADDFAFQRNVLHKIQSSLKMTSATVEVYMLNDYLAGITPRADMVVFSSTFRMTSAQAAKLKARLEKDKSHCIWCFLPGYIGDDGKYSIDNVERLTGFKLMLVPGSISSCGISRDFKSLKWNTGPYELNLSERPVIMPSAYYKILAKYVSDGKASAAMRVKNGVYTFFIGSPGGDENLFRAMLKLSGIHLWTDKPALVQRNNKYLFIYTGKAGRISVNIPSGVSLKALDADIVEERYNRIELKLNETGSAWLRYLEDAKK